MTEVINPGEGYEPSGSYYGGSGEYTDDSGVNWGDDNVPQSCEWPYVQTTIPYSITQIVPGQPASPGQPYIPPSIAQVEDNNNAGWDNSCASSVAELLPGQKVSFEIYHDSRGQFVGLDRSGRELQWIGSYSVGLKYTQDGLFIFEGNVEKAQISSGLSPGNIVEIMRFADGSVGYRVNGITTLSNIRIEPTDHISVYCVSYEAGDQLLSAEISNFIQTQVLFDFIEFHQVIESYSISGTATGGPSGKGFIEFDQIIEVQSQPGEAVVFDQIIETLQRSENNGICDLVSVVTIPRGSMAELDEHNALVTEVTLPVVSMKDEVPPPRLTVLESVLPPVGSIVEAISIETAELVTNVTMPTPSIAELDEYNALVTEVTFPATDGIYQTPAGYMLLYNDMVVSDELSTFRDAIISLYVGLAATDNIEMFKSALMVLDESLSADPKHVLLADRQISLDEVCSVIDDSKFAIDDLPDHTGGVAWVMNIKSGATSIFLDYGFNSFFEYESEAYGVSDTGIYALQETSTDCPASGIDYGLSSFGSRTKKRIPHFYAALSSTGKIFLRLLVDGQKAEYFALSSTEHVEPNKINVGRGFHAVYWNPILIAPKGVKIIELDALEWQPMTFKRRV